MRDYERSRQYFRNAMSLLHEINRVTPWFVYVSEFWYGRIEMREGLIDSATARLNKMTGMLPEVAEAEPTYAQVAEYYAAFYRAELLLAKGSVEEAIAVGRSLPEMDFPQFGTARTFFYNHPINRDILARAYVQKGALGDAIAEYERIVTFDPAGRERRLVYPLFHYRLGVLYEQTGRPDKAIQHYEKFLEICGDADPGLTEVPDARRRLASLTGD
jgi:tetratricopeptide (TPR) repeat protein